MPTVLVDLDGTLADCNHRRHHAEAGDYKKFHDKLLVARDTLNPMVAATVRGLLREGYTVLYVTGRDYSLEATTRTWLRNNGMWYYPFKLFMRGEGDDRPDHVIKLEILKLLRGMNYDITLAIDDRDSVVKMWREQGIQCFQVAPGDF